MGVCDGLEFLFPDGLDFWDVCGVATTEHEGGGVFAGEGLSKILHQRFDAAPAGELFADF